MAGLLDRRRSQLFVCAVHIACNMKMDFFKGARVRFLTTIAAALASVAILMTVFTQTSVMAAQPAIGLQQEDSDQADDASPVTPTPLTPIGLLSPTVALSETSAPTFTVNQDAESTEETAVQASTTPVQDSELDGSEPLAGTIISNRTNYGARFFLEGQMYRISPFASAGLDLVRSTAVLNLFTCDASTPETQDDCYWDPYLLQRDGFYEVVDESVVVGLPTLVLGDANAPPADQVWIHNRTGITESVVFRDIVHEVTPGAVQEFDVEIGAPVIVYVRSCGSLDAKEVCEWAPSNLEPGAYFAMVEVSTPGGIPGSRVTTVDLRPVLDAGGTALSAPVRVTCQLGVPALNIRSGPGLQYQIVGKIRGTPDEAATVAITGRSADGLWYTVVESVAASGWITANADFLTCRSSTDELPIAEFTGAPLAPTPTPVPAPVVVVPPPEPAPDTVDSTPVEQPVVADAPIQEEPTVEVADVVTPTEEAPDSAIPEGLSMLMVNNGFQYPIRFTVDQRFRPIEGPSEFDLEPGASTNVLVFPGTVAFTASSPWNGLSGNADIQAVGDQSVVMWLRFEPEPDDSSQWKLAWE